MENIVIRQKFYVLEFLIIFLTVYTCDCRNTEYRDLEASLLTELFTNYSVLQRPTRTVNVELGFTLLTVNELSTKDQVLSISGYLTVHWEDDRLSWSDSSSLKKDYSSVNFLFSTETYVWRPAIMIENSVQDMSVISDNNIPMRIKSDGNIHWSPAGVYKVSCESDITYYPLDSQFCSIIISSSGYTSKEISLAFIPDREGVNLNHYTPNGEWELLNITYEEGTERSLENQDISYLEITIHLRRRPAFHILNTLFPVSLMATLISMVFKVPVDSGEKIGFSLTVLLAYAVYLTLLSGNIPSTSLTVCYLTIYLAVTLALGTFAVLSTIIVLNIHFRKKEEEIPGWLRHLTLKVLVKVACYKHYCFCFKFGKGKIKPEANVQSTDTPTKDKEVIFDQDMSLKSEMGNYEEIQLNWQELALILDKLFFVIYISVVSIFTFVFWTLLLVNYASAN